jgi:hypothetical protein
MTRGGDYSILEYLYRDAGNYKTHGAVLLAGRAKPADAATIRASLDDARFVVEQVGIAPLQPQHLRDCGSEAGELDHGFHEFATLRAAEGGEADGEVARMTVVELVQRFREAAGRWDPGRSKFGR